MHVVRARLVLVEVKKAPILPPSELALGPDMRDFLGGHLVELSKKVGASEEQRGVFQRGTDMVVKLKSALKAKDSDFSDFAATMATRLSESMKGATAPKAGVLVAIQLAPNEKSSATAVALLKLEANHKGARLMRQAKTLTVQYFKDMLAQPGDLQKALYWPDPRLDSDVTVRDRNPKGAQYFASAFQVQLSAKAPDAEKALIEEVQRRIPADRRARALRLAAQGDQATADVAVARIQKEFPEFEPQRPALGGDGRLPGIIRPVQFASWPVTLTADGIKIIVPQDRLGQVVSKAVGDHWETTITTAVEPH